MGLTSDEVQRRVSAAHPAAGNCWAASGRSRPLLHSKKKQQSTPSTPSHHGGCRHVRPLPQAHAARHKVFVAGVGLLTQHLRRVLWSDDVPASDTTVGGSMRSSDSTVAGCAQAV